MWKWNPVADLNEEGYIQLTNKPFIQTYLAMNSAEYRGAFH